LKDIALIFAMNSYKSHYALPIVLSTVNVKTGLSAPTIHQLAEVLAGIEELDRTTINAWEDEEFVTAVRATGRKKLIMTALWTEACLSFPALDALREGYEVYPVVDAVGGTSVEAHRAGRQPHRAGWRTTHERGSADVRTAARLGAHRDRAAGQRDSFCA
jgi:nicotinamidase-related amidase